MTATLALWGGFNAHFKITHIGTASLWRIMREHSNFARSAAIAIAVTATLTLSGCFANPLDQITDKIGSEIAEGGAEKLIEGMTGGELDIEAGSLPKDFPSEVPVVDGEIISSVGMTLEEGRTWSVTLKVDDSLAAMATAREQLVSAGFEETLWNEAQSMTMGIFSKGESFSVMVTGSAFDDEDHAVGYQVTKATE